MATSSFTEEPLSRLSTIVPTPQLSISWQKAASPFFGEFSLLPRVGTGSAVGRLEIGYNLHDYTNCQQTFFSEFASKRKSTPYKGSGSKMNFRSKVLTKLQ